MVAVVVAGAVAVAAVVVHHLEVEVEAAELV